MLKPAMSIDLEQYIKNGKIWYEIASFPAWFQKGCTGTTASYVKKEKYVEVNNTCFVNGKEKKKIGKAFKTVKENVLKVQFFAPFKADYIIEFVDETYTYAVVGSSGKNYLWILSRVPPGELKKGILDELMMIALDRGYNVGKLHVTEKKK